MIALETPASRAMSAMRVADGPRAAKARQAAARMFSLAREDRSRAGIPGAAAPGSPASRRSRSSRSASALPGVSASSSLRLDAQRGLVAHAQLVGERPRRDVAVAFHQVPGGREPGRHAEAGALHEGAGGGIDLRPAVVAGVRAAPRDAVEAAHHAAVPADGADTVRRVKSRPQPVQAGRLVADRREDGGHLRRLVVLRLPIHAASAPPRGPTWPMVPADADL